MCAKGLEFWKTSSFVVATLKLACPVTPSD